MEASRNFLLDFLSKSEPKVVKTITAHIKNNLTYLKGLPKKYSSRDTIPLTCRWCKFHSDFDQDCKKEDVFVFLFSLAAYQSLYPLLLLLPLSIQIAQHEGQIHFWYSLWLEQCYVDPVSLNFESGSGSGAILFDDPGSGSGPNFFYQ